MQERIMADDFINVYPVSKTLRFELIPVGRTQEYIERDGIIDTDTARAVNYKTIKNIIDRYHKEFIEGALASIVLLGLDEYLDLYNIPVKTDAEKKKMEKVQSDLRKQIVNAFKKHPMFSVLSKKELIKNELPKFVKGNSEEEKIVEGFSEFTTYFTGFNQNRENMYSDEEKSTAIAFRIIHQNLPKFIDNMKVFRTFLTDMLDAELAQMNMIFSAEFGTKFDSIEKYFCLDGFSECITQKGIDFYNTLLGGFSKQDGTKVQGLNEYINLFNQKTGKKIPKLKPLFKQILSDRTSSSFIPEQFQSDLELFTAVDEAYSLILQEVIENETEMSLGSLFEKIDTFDLNHIYISNDSTITSLSQSLFSDWSVIKNSISRAYDIAHPIGKTKPEKYDEKKKKELKKVGYYSIAELNRFLEEVGYPTNISGYFAGSIPSLINALSECHEKYLMVDRNKYNGKSALKNTDKDIAVIKGLLDAFKSLQLAIKPFIIGQDASDKDEVFYGELTRIWECLDIITPLYNKVRNYVTCKPYSTEKIKLNFGKATLLNGWDKNKERDNLGVILIKDGFYYLGIMNRNDTKCFENAPVSDSDSDYQKMDYKLLPGPNKMLPKVFFSKSRIEEFAPSPELLANYNAGTHKKGDQFNLTDCHNLIDFFKRSIEKHEDWSKFDFHFSDTETYADMSDFYREVSNQGYKITYTGISSEYIDQLIDEGRLYLFKIYNKDFSPFSKGTPNLHTMYWKALFDPENLKDVVYKLNGEAEVFFRRASIEYGNRVIHPANQVISNKDPQNAKKESIFEYDLIKDRRFTCDKYQFHVPITMNYKAAGESRMNLRVNSCIHNTDNGIHVIGIDRGERNLLYVSVIDEQGQIVEQMSLNEILTYDKNNNLHRRNYHALLETREKENIAARQNWSTINTIKELKEGYLSQVIHVLAELMVKYNAIVVLEDLNFGFKRGRQKVERQVYQKFEKMLIEKLNYYVDKAKNPSSGGGLYKAYQLTAVFESFQKLGKQSGFLYYVPAWNTSKIDPTTGFVNLLYTKYESVDKSKDFVRNIDVIRFDEETQCYAFGVDYRKFTYKADGTKTKWTIYSNGERITHFRNPAKNNEWDASTVQLTDAFEALFTEYGINDKTCDLKKMILNINEADFYRRFMHLFSMMVQMRNSDETRGIDQIISPVKGADGRFFVSGEDETRPIDADANGAYNIAKKGLMLVKMIQESEEDELGKLKLAISNKEWLAFAQENTL